MQNGAAFVARLNAVSRGDWTRLQWYRPYAHALPAPRCAATLSRIAVAAWDGSSSIVKPAHPSAGSSPESSIPLDEGVVFGAAGLSWRVAYNGYGQVVQTAGSGVISIALIPSRATSPADTHAALVLSQRSWRDLTAEIRVRTNRQLRSPHPNPWEVGWILWHYLSDQHFYYVALKPNGWELGKEDPAYPGNQRFLATGADPVFATDRWYTVTIQQRRDVITVTVDGDRLVRFTDDERPYQFGRVGLYTEDSSSTFEPRAISGH
jgi:hypothetical protein